MATTNEILNGSGDAEYEAFRISLPENLRNSGAEYQMRRYWELGGQPANFQDALSKQMFFKEKDGYHAPTVSHAGNEVYEFMKSGSHPTVYKELDWYYGNTPGAVDFRRTHALNKNTGTDYWRYEPRDPADDATMAQEAQAYQGLRQTKKLRPEEKSIWQRGNFTRIRRKSQG